MMEYSINILALMFMVKFWFGFILTLGVTCYAIDGYQANKERGTNNGS